ncbi:MAG TPA: lipoyl synthase [Candidatus Hydrogenedens sp.]|mgnify:CR=1 FL=1|nr:lipoyl synthase [Candidatus Hydrogenedens sp.]
MNCETNKKSSFPSWIRFRIPESDELSNVHLFLDNMGISTVCRSALCPNRLECWSHKTATFLLLGEVCSRKCAFCAIKKGIPTPIDLQEKDKIIKAVEVMELQYIVLTMVTRDDLPDGGAGHIAEIVLELKHKFPERKVEVLVSDLQGNIISIKTIINSKPDVFSHNIETVQRLCPKIRDSKYSYSLSLEVLGKAKELSSKIKTKSGFMLGLGETNDEVLQTLKDLNNIGCSIVTIGQYLQPTKKQVPVVRFVTPDEFNFYTHWAEENLSLKVIAGPEVRSSYHADFWCKENEV